MEEPTISGGHMAGKMTGEDIDLLKEVFMTRQNVEDVLDRHGTRIGKEIALQFEPRFMALESGQAAINNRLVEGNKKFGALESKLQSTTDECVKRAKNCPHIMSVAEKKALREAGHEIELDEIEHEGKKIRTYIAIAGGVLIALVGAAVSIYVAIKTIKP